MIENKPLTGYPSIDKPWLKYYSEEAINAPLPECSMYEYIWQNNKDHPDDIALIFYDKKITYGEMFKQIDRVAKAFVAAGIKEKDIVTLMMLNQPETVYCIYALNKIGAVASVINVLSSPDEIEQYLKENKSDCFVVLDVFFDKCYKAAKNRGIKSLIWISLFNSKGLVSKIGYRMKVKAPDCPDDFIVSWNRFIKAGEIVNELPQIKRNSMEVAMIGHTGGTTGFPKGVLLSNYNYNAVSFQCLKYFNFKRQDTLLNLIVPHATYGIVVNIHLPLSLGMTTILVPKVDPEHVDDIIVKYRPNFVPSIPLYWTSVINSKKISDMSFLKWASIGGSGISTEQITQFNQLAKAKNSKSQLLIGYGLTETCALISVQMKGHVALGSVGFPLPRMVISAFDSETMEEKRYNQIGEICITGPSLMIGYLNNENETNAVLEKHNDGRLWLHSGDLGYVDEKGNVFIQGRMKRIYLTIMNGLHSKIFPDRIEQALIKQPDVLECGVICVNKGKNVYRPVAFCVLKDSNQSAQNEVEKELKILAIKELPEYDLPERYVFCDALPHTSHGKIDYRALEERATKKAIQ